MRRVGLQPAADHLVAGVLVRGDLHVAVGDGRAAEAAGPAEAAGLRTPPGYERRLFTALISDNSHADE